MYITSCIVETIVGKARDHANASTGELSNASRNNYLWCVAYAGVLADTIMQYPYEDWQQAYDAIAARCSHMAVVAEITNALLRQGVRRWYSSKAHRPSLKLKKSWRRVKGSAV